MQKNRYSQEQVNSISKLISNLSDKLVYVASPYSTIRRDPELEYTSEQRFNDQCLKEQRFYDVCEFVANLINFGILPFCPIAMSHPLTKFNVPGHWQYWKKLDETFIDKCDVLLVYQMKGWENSVGIKAELEYANKVEKQIEMVEPKLFGFNH